MNIKITEIVVKKFTVENDPEVYYHIPSGYAEKVIQVFESGYGELEVKLISRDVANAMEERPGIIIL